MHNRTKRKAEGLIRRGARWCDGVPSLAAECDVVITIIGYPKDVLDVYLGETGLVRHARPGTFLVDMTTSDPESRTTHRRRGARARTPMPRRAGHRG